MDFVLCTIHSLSDYWVIGAFDKHPTGNFMDWPQVRLRVLTFWYKEKKTHYFSFSKGRLSITAIYITFPSNGLYTPTGALLGNCDTFAPLDVFVFH